MIHLYYHGGSANHGCEAIVRSTFKIIGKGMNLWTTSPEEDDQYGVGNVVSIHDDRAEAIPRKSVQYFLSALNHKFTGTDYVYTRFTHKDFLKNVSYGDVCMSIGGDNYCYTGLDRLGYYNKMLHKRGAKTVLWGCSIDPKVLTQEVIKDLRRYDLITVRESLSYEGLLQAGIKGNVVLCADPAFHLDVAQVHMPKGFTKENTIGINVSPLVTESGHMVLENYIELVRFILEETSDNVLLIPHVVKAETDDRTTLRDIYSQFKGDQGNQRIAMLNDCNCMELKGYISQCKIFVGARTHATIAAYSTGVPTLVVGYSIKARGIAKDIFGTEENYVIPVQGLESVKDLLDAYLWIAEHAKEIEKYLIDTMPQYKQKSLVAVNALGKLG